MNLSADKYGGPTKQWLSSSRWVTSSDTDGTTTAASSTVGMPSAKQKRTGCSRCVLTSFQVCHWDNFGIWTVHTLHLWLAFNQCLRVAICNLTEPNKRKVLQKFPRQKFPRYNSFVEAVSQSRKLLLDKQCHKAIPVCFLCYLGCTLLLSARECMLAHRTRV